MSDYAKLVEDLKRGFGHWYVEDWSRLVSMYADAAAAMAKKAASALKKGAAGVCYRRGSCKREDSFL